MLAIHLEFIEDSLWVGYDGRRNVSKEEKHMVAATEPPPEDRKEQAVKIPGWVKVTATVILVGVVAVIVFGYWTTPGWVGVSGKRFWDYLELLIVPVVIAGGVALINWMQSARQRQSEAKQKEHEQEMEELHRQHELEVERQRAMDAALETYIDKMETMLYERSILALSRSELEYRGVIHVIRARPLTLLERLDGMRKRAVMRFLSETLLILRLDEHYERPLLELRDANFSDAELTDMKLSDLNLSGARLTNAKLANTVLSGADLHAADLSGANLSGAQLGLSGAVLSVSGEEDAVPAEPKLADLRRVDLSYANLEGTAGWTVEQLARAKTLEGATMPDGQILKSADHPDGPTFEEWSKSKGRGEDGEVATETGE